MSQKGHPCIFLETSRNLDTNPSGELQEEDPGPCSLRFTSNCDFITSYCDSLSLSRFDLPARRFCSSSPKQSVLLRSADHCAQDARPISQQAVTQISDLLQLSHSSTYVQLFLVFGILLVRGRHLLTIPWALAYDLKGKCIFQKYPFRKPASGMIPIVNNLIS